MVYFVLISAYSAGTPYLDSSVGLLDGWKILSSQADSPWAQSLVVPWFGLKA
jgi:hypothetical protein